MAPEYVTHDRRLILLPIESTKKISGGQKASIFVDFSLKYSRWNFRQIIPIISLFFDVYIQIMAAKNVAHHRRLIFSSNRINENYFRRLEASIMVDFSLNYSRRNFRQIAPIFSVFYRCLFGNNASKYVAHHRRLIFSSNRINENYFRRLEASILVD